MTPIYTFFALLYLYLIGLGLWRRRKNILRFFGWYRFKLNRAVRKTEKAFGSTYRKPPRNSLEDFKSDYLQIKQRGVWR